MVIRPEGMEKEIKQNMRGGSGAIEILHLAPKQDLRNCRLLAELTIQPGGSIGSHRHDKETEYFIITSGEGMVDDDGIERKVSPGDVVVTGNGASHSIRCTGNSPLKMTAIIITYEN